MTYIGTEVDHGLHKVFHEVPDRSLGSAVALGLDLVSLLFQNGSTKKIKLGSNSLW